MSQVSNILAHHINCQGGFRIHVSQIKRWLCPVMYLSLINFTNARVCLECCRSKNGVNSRHGHCYYFCYTNCNVTTSWTQSINTIGRANVSHPNSSVQRTIPSHPGPAAVNQEEEVQNKCNVQIGSYYTDAACLITTLTYGPHRPSSSVQRSVCLSGHRRVPVAAAAAASAANPNYTCGRYDEQLFGNFGDNSLLPRCHNWPTKRGIQ